MKFECEKKYFAACIKERARQTHKFVVCHRKNARESFNSGQLHFGGGRVHRKNTLSCTLKGCMKKFLFAMCQRTSMFLK
jgi:hypothetical protein